MISETGGLQESAGQAGNMRRTITPEQLKRDVDQWLSGGRIEGQRYARIIKSTAALTQPEVGDRAASNVHHLIVSSRALTPADLSVGEYTAFLRVMAQPNAGEVVEDMLNVVSRDRSHWPADYAEKGLRGRYYASFRSLQSLVYPEQASASQAGAPMEAPGWERACRVLYDSMLSAYGKRSEEKVSPTTMFMYRMMRVASTLGELEYNERLDAQLIPATTDTQQEFQNSAHGTLPVHRWIQYAEPRMGVGLTKVDNERVGRILGLFGVGDADLTKRMRAGEFGQAGIADASKGDEYAKAVAALDVFLKEPSRFPDHMRGLGYGDK
ncbi:MAG: hypothetical protein ABIH11_02545 [Candidatus Altiarchaeota archaeon]